MASVNKVILLGHLGRDPEPRTFANGVRVAYLALATTERGRHGADGALHTHTEWHRVVLPEPLADALEPGVRKGALVYVEGRLHTHRWQPARNAPPRQQLQVRAERLQLLLAATPRPRAAPAAEDDDLPF